MRIRQSALVLVLLVAAWGSASHAGVSDLRTVQTLLFRAVGNEPNVLTMTGSKVVPPSGSLETGTATISYLAPNLSYNITHNVLGATTAAIRGPGYGYENGPVIFNLTPVTSPIVGSVLLNAAQEDRLLEGRLYIQINSVTFPGGAIRTQLQAVNPPSEGRAVWIRVQVENLGPDPYDGVDLFKIPGIAVPPARGTKVTVDIDEPSKPGQLDRPAAVASKDFQADIPVGATIEFDLGYFAYFPSFPTAHTEALAEVDSLNIDPNPANNTVQNDFAVALLAGVPVAGVAGFAALGTAIAAFAVRSARRRRRADTNEEDA